MSMRRRLLAAIACTGILCSCAHGERPQHQAPEDHRFTVATTKTGLGLWRYNYIGKWEMVYGRHDGRWQGSSVRSFRTGNSVGFAFAGNRVRIYGVLGPGGGYGSLAIDDAVRDAKLDFYAPHKRTHALVYESPVLTKGYHALAIMVTGMRSNPHGGTFVNVDSIEVETNAQKREFRTTQP